jgi:hypothetical protein
MKSPDRNIVSTEAVGEMLNILYQYSEYDDGDDIGILSEDIQIALNKLHLILDGDLTKEHLEPMFQRLGELLGVKYGEAYQAFLDGKYSSWNEAQTALWEAQYGKPHPSRALEVSNV